MDIEQQIDGLAIFDDEDVGIPLENDTETFPEGKLSYVLWGGS